MRLAGLLPAPSEAEALLASRREYPVFQEELDRTGRLEVRRQDAVKQASSACILRAFREGLGAPGDEAVDMALSEGARR